MIFQCYYVGGLEESATGMLNDLSKPISWGVPAEKVCFKLYKKDRQICDLKYGNDPAFTYITVSFNIGCFHRRRNRGGRGGSSPISKDIVLFSYIDYY